MQEHTVYPECIAISVSFYFPDSGKGHPNVRGPKKEWIMNPNGKSYVCILHEYVQHALKKQPSYEFKELGNSNCLFCIYVPQRKWKLISTHIRICRTKVEH